MWSNKYNENDKETSIVITIQDIWNKIIKIIFLSSNILTYLLITVTGNTILKEHISVLNLSKNIRSSKRLGEERL